MRPYLRAANVTWTGLDLSDVNQMNFTDSEIDTYRLQAGDILLGEASGSPGEVGKPALWSDEIEDCAFQNTLIRVRSRGPEPRYLLHYFRHLARSGEFADASRGVGIHHIGRANLASWQVPVPPVEEQRRIVDILEDHLSRLDAAEVGLDQAAARVRILREQFIRTELFPSPRDGDPSAVLPPSVDALDDVVPSLSPSWRWARLEDLADVVGGITKDSGRQSDPTFVEVPYLRVANVQRGRLDLRVVTTIRAPATKATALTLKPGDVLLNEGGDRDKLGRGWVWEGQIDNCIHQNHVFRARIRDEALRPRLLSWAANSVGGQWCERNGKQSVNLASISLSKIRRMPIPVPPVADQAAIEVRILACLDSCGRLQQSIERVRRESRSLRRALLAAAFSGGLTGDSTSVSYIKELADV